MVITICILMLINSILGNPMGSLIEKAKCIDWKNQMNNAFNVIKLYAKKAGRTATRPLLLWWNVMEDSQTSTTDKALIYGAILYIAIPNDLIPRRIMSFLGIIDDLAVAAWLSNKIEEKITDDIRQKVEDTLDDWFGIETIEAKLVTK